MSGVDFPSRKKRKIANFVFHHTNCKFPVLMIDFSLNCHTRCEKLGTPEIRLTITCLSPMFSEPAPDMQNKIFLPTGVEMFESENIG